MPTARILLTAIALVGAIAQPARGDLRYVALGDSYSSGAGARAYVDQSCRRSQLAFPFLVAHAVRGAGLALAACAGATTGDVLSTQVGSLTADTALVTVTIGGNDAGFSSVLTECAKPGWMSDCAARVTAAQAFIRATLPARLDAVDDQIAARAPSARVVVVGYPRLFGARDCDALTWFSAGDRRRLNATADLLAAVTRARARVHGFAFADPIEAFAGHAVCDERPWVTGLTLPIADSFHPTAEGQRALAGLVVRALR